MTETEAWIYLASEPGEDLEDAYEIQLFEHKQFFMSKTVLPTLFLKRLEKIALLDKAYLVLGGIFSSKQTFFSVDFKPSQVLLESFQHYQGERNKLRLAIGQCKSGEDLSFVVEQLLFLEAAYISKWETTEDEDSSIILSKEKDAMELLKAMREYADNGGLTFEDLKNNRNNPPEILIYEMKRLSLLFKKYTWTKI